VQKMKKLHELPRPGRRGVGGFLHRIRRVATEAEFFKICEDHFKSRRPMKHEPLSEGSVNEIVIF